MAQYHNTLVTNQEKNSRYLSVIPYFIEYEFQLCPIWHTSIKANIKTIHV